MFKLLNSIWCAFYQENIKYFHCSLVKPQITFDKNLQNVPFESLMKDHSHKIQRGIQLGKENGLSLLLDAETYDYAFSPQKGKLSKVNRKMINILTNLTVAVNLCTIFKKRFITHCILGEGYKIAIHSHQDQPIMSLSDIDLSPGFVTQLSVTPTLRDTTDQGNHSTQNSLFDIIILRMITKDLNYSFHVFFTARWRFTPEERGCYFEGELNMKYLPSNLYRQEDNSK